MPVSPSSRLKMQAPGPINYTVSPHTSNLHGNHCANIKSCAVPEFLSRQQRTVITLKYAQCDQYDVDTCRSFPLWLLCKVHNYTVYKYECVCAHEGGGSCFVHALQINVIHSSLFINKRNSFFSIYTSIQACLYHNHLRKQNKTENCQWCGPCAVSVYKHLQVLYDNMPIHNNSGPVMKDHLASYYSSSISS
jgi:hypothetical protein